MPSAAMPQKMTRGTPAAADDMQLGETMSPHTSIASSNGKAILTEITQYTNAAGFLEPCEQQK